jgi:hypothetical protein
MIVIPPPPAPPPTPSPPPAELTAVLSILGGLCGLPAEGMGGGGGEGAGKGASQQILTTQTTSFQKSSKEGMTAHDDGTHQHPTWGWQRL